MLRAPGIAAVRFTAAVAMGAPLVIGCTSILGIDGSYIATEGAGGKSGRGGAGGSGDQVGAGGTEIVEAGGSGNVPPPTGDGGAGGAGGDGGAGGTQGDGGAGGAGGAFDAGSGNGAGGAADPACRTGHYSGSFKGGHAPSFIPFVTVPLGVSGTVSFQLMGTGGMLQIATGTIKATLAGFGPFDASVDGSYDCPTHQMAGHIAGKINGLTAIDGTLTGDLQSSDDQTRPWAEHEVQLPKYVGSGTWNATRTGP